MSYKEKSKRIYTLSLEYEEKFNAITAQIIAEEIIKVESLYPLGKSETNHKLAA